MVLHYLPNWAHSAEKIRSYEISSPELGLRRETFGLCSFKEVKTNLHRERRIPPESLQLVDVILVPGYDLIHEAFTRPTGPPPVGPLGGYREVL